MKLHPSTHKGIFLAAAACLAVAVFIAASLADADRKTHISYYEVYEEANALFEDGNFAESYETFKNLALVYDDSYILELKMAVCAMNLGMWAEAVEHSRRTLVLRPLLARDEDFIKGITYSLEQIGETETAGRIDSYFYGKNAERLNES